MTTRLTELSCHCPPHQHRRLLRISSVHLLGKWPLSRVPLGARNGRRRYIAISNRTNQDSLQNTIETATQGAIERKES
eukprot:14220981-Alexandrium_andersonii.AAC.1